MVNVGEQPIRGCIKKLKKIIRKEALVKFVATYITTKASLRIRKFHYKADIFCKYILRCPGCYDNYIGKRERATRERINEHGYRLRDSVV